MNYLPAEHLFSIRNEEDFEKAALEIFRIQASENPVYKEYISHLGLDPMSVFSVDQIPFLPIEFFKNHKVITGAPREFRVFESSGTTGSETSRHYVSDLSVYEQSFITCFRLFFGDPEDYFFAALLPSYLGRPNSSLVYMAEGLINLSSDRRSSFYLDNIESMLSVIREVRAEKKKIMLIGVTFALLDLAEKYPSDLSNVIVVETGGMKGRRKEMIREELHSILMERLNISHVCSEYGMTELLSQAWSKGEGIFHTPPWMKIRLREVNDPFTPVKEAGITGGINIIDLANINSCSFIATGDIGKLTGDEGFEVLGRFSNSDLRGCNLLVQ